MNKYIILLSIFISAPLFARVNPNEDCNILFNELTAFNVSVTYQHYNGQTMTRVASVEFKIIYLRRTWKISEKPAILQEKS